MVVRRTDYTVGSMHNCCAEDRILTRVDLRAAWMVVKTTQKTDVKKALDSVK